MNRSTDGQTGVPKTPDTPEQATIREENLRRFRKRHGRQWIEDNWARLEAEWEIAKGLME